MPKKVAVSEDTFVALARVALLEVTGVDTFEDKPAVTHESESVTVSYPSTQPGYPGWAWTISVSNVSGVDPSVLEVGLLPGEGSLVAPDWVPWADRLEEYQRLEAEREREDAPTDEDDDDDDIDIDDALDGIDIDQLDLNPAGLEVPDEPNDVFDHVDFDED